MNKEKDKMKSAMHGLMRCKLNIVDDRPHYKLATIVYHMCTDGLSEWLDRERKRMGSGYESYYSPDAIPLAHKVETILLYDPDEPNSLRRLVIEAVNSVKDMYELREFNFHNMEKLYLSSVPQLIRPFEDDFRGDIQDVLRIDDAIVIVSNHIKDGTKFYLVKNDDVETQYFSSLRDAMVYHWGKRHYDAIITLMNSR